MSTNPRSLFLFLIEYWCLAAAAISLMCISPTPLPLFYTPFLPSHSLLRACVGCVGVMSALLACFAVSWRRVHVSFSALGLKPMSLAAPRGRRWSAPRATEACRRGALRGPVGAAPQVCLRELLSCLGRGAAVGAAPPSVRRGGAGAVGRLRGRGRREETSRRAAALRCAVAARAGVPRPSAALRRSRSCAPRQPASSACALLRSSRTLEPLSSLVDSAPWPLTRRAAEGRFVALSGGVTDLPKGLLSCLGRGVASGAAPPSVRRGGAGAAGRGASAGAAVVRRRPAGRRLRAGRWRCGLECRARRRLFAGLPRA